LEFSCLITWPQIINKQTARARRAPQMGKTKRLLLHFCRTRPQQAGWPWQDHTRTLDFNASVSINTTGYRGAHNRFLCFTVSREIPNLVCKQLFLDNFRSLSPNGDNSAWTFSASYCKAKLEPQRQDLKFT